MTKEFNPWKHVELDMDSLKNNRYLNPKKEEEVPEPVITSEPAKVSDKNDYLELEGIVCTDADGNEFEKYDRIYVSKDIDRKADGSQINYTPYQAITHFEKQKMFLPSFALSCNIVAALYANRSDSEVNNVLMQYKDYGSGLGWHAQNTIVEWNKKKGKVIHYPHDSDFPKYGGSDDVNKGKRKALDFKVEEFDDMALEDALKKKHFKNYLKNLTGFKNPEILIEIGQYFNKPAMVWVPGNVGRIKGTRSSWLGCGSSDFSLIADDDLNDSSAARGVLSGEPR